MATHDAAREKVQTYVTALAGCLGFRPEQLTFKWEEVEGMGIPSISQTSKVHTTRVCVQNHWTTMIFTDSEMQGLDIAPEQVLSGHKTEILEALRRLIGLIKPIPESECVDRWLGEGDAFPGEPA